MPYTLATIVQKDPPGPDDRVHLVVEFTGSGVPAQRHETYLDGTSTGLSLKQWRDRMIADLNGRKTIADTVTVLDTINAAPAPTAPTAAQVWVEKAGRLARAKAIGLTGAGATAVTALQSDVDGTYQAGYLTDV